MWGKSVEFLICFIEFISAPIRLAGVLDLTDEVQKADEAFSNNENDDNAMRGEGDEETRKRSSSAARQVTQYFGIANGTGGMVRCRGE